MSSVAHSLAGVYDDSNIVATLGPTEFFALARLMANVTKAFDLRHVYIENSVMRMDIPFSKAMVEVDMATLLKKEIDLSLVFKKGHAKYLWKMKGRGDVVIVDDDDNGVYIFDSGNISISVDKYKITQSISCVPIVVCFFGVPMTGYKPQTLKDYISKSSFIDLIVYGDQLEALHAAGNPNPYFFNPSMAGILRKRTPTMELRSQTWFRFFEGEQTLRIGKVGERHVLVVENMVDLDTTLYVYELLT